MEECEHTPIGNALNKGISGGQAKRVNIGLALIKQSQAELSARLGGVVVALDSNGESSAGIQTEPGFRSSKTTRTIQ